jgi:hypothetical protein
MENNEKKEETVTISKSQYRFFIVLTITLLASSAFNLIVALLR